MDDHAIAMSILCHAREILANRMIERILDAEDQILEDAQGDSYMNEIETLQESVGERLNSVNIMLANLSVIEPLDEMAFDLENPIIFLGSIALDEEVDESGRTESPANFALFTEQIAADDVEGAGQTLAELLEVDLKLAQRCATSFRDRLNEDPTTIEKAMRLRVELMAGNHNDSLMILWDCFRLQGRLAFNVLQTLKSRLLAE